MKTSKNIEVYLAVFLVIILIWPIVVSSYDPSSEPLAGPSTMNVWGQAYLDGAFVPEGALITAWIDGTQYGSYNAIFDGWYDLDISGDWTETLYLKEGGVDNDLVIFEYVEGSNVYYAAETVIYDVNGILNNKALNFSSSVEEPVELKINELCTDDGLGSQYNYVYNPTAAPVVLDDYYLQKDISGSINGYNGAIVALSGTINAGGLSFVDLGAAGFLETSADELKLVWDNPGSIVADGNDIIIDRVEYGNEDLVPDNTTLLDAPAPPSEWCIRRTPTGQDTDDCAVDFQLYSISSVPPAPPTNLTANLTGNSFQNVTLEWILSIDDGGGGDDVVSYDLYRSTNDFFGSYQMVAQIGAGNTSWTDVGAGDGDPNDYFYFVEANDTAGLSSRTDYNVGKSTILLSAGWNLISIPLEMENEEISTVLQTIDWQYVQWFDVLDINPWKSNSISRPDSLDDLWLLNHTMGFWLNVADIDNLTITGRVRTSNLIPLYAGWNLVGYPSQTQRIASETLPYEVDRIAVYDVIEPYRIRETASLETIIMEQGNGYWVHSTSDVNWDVEEFTLPRPDPYPIYGQVYLYNGSSIGGYNPLLSNGDATVNITWWNPFNGVWDSISTTTNILGQYSVDIDNYSDGGVVFINATFETPYSNKGYNYTYIDVIGSPGGIYQEVVCGIPYEVRILQPSMFELLSSATPFNIEYEIVDRDGLRAEGYFTFFDGVFNISAVPNPPAPCSYEAPSNQTFDGTSSPDSGHFMGPMTIYFPIGQQWNINVSEGGPLEPNPYLTPWGQFYIDPNNIVPGWLNDSDEIIVIIFM